MQYKPGDIVGDKTVLSVEEGELDTSIMFEDETSAWASQLAPSRYDRSMSELDAGL